MNVNGPLACVRDNTCIQHTPSIDVTMTTPVSQVSRVDVRETGLDERRSSTLLAYRRLSVGDTMELVDGKDPVDLYTSLNTIAPGDFSWLYLERGPAAWRVSVRKLSRIYSAGECCGMCGGGSRHPVQNRSNP
jgi:uncharacterized protein (DUF2249 family)